MPVEGLRNFSVTRIACVLAATAATACLVGCGQPRGQASAAAGGPSAQLVAMHYGRLVDVYGLDPRSTQTTVSLYRSDLLVGPDIQDERPSGSQKRDAAILYDFLSAHPDTLQPRLLITREIGSPAFEAAVAALDDHLRSIAPTVYGSNSPVTPYSVVPRNAAIRLVFSNDLGITDEFFYAIDELGRVTGVKNTQAVQLLEITGDPGDARPDGDFRVLDARIIVRGPVLTLDPVLLGVEGPRLGTRNTASGMPPSPDQRRASIRIALATIGPLALPGLAPSPTQNLNGMNNDGRTSVIRDFRAGNARDNSVDLARGFLRDPLPPRLIGHLPMYLARVEAAGPAASILTVFKAGIEHELDRGDLLRIFDGTGSTPVASLEILRDPPDDLGRPEVQRVRVMVRRVIGASGGKILETLDPTRRPGYPPVAGPQRDRFLRQWAPRVVVVAEFTRRRPHPTNIGKGGQPTTYGDDPRNFLTFSPRPLPTTGTNSVAGRLDHVSPFAGAIVRFSKPIDLRSVGGLDSAFFATRNVMATDAIATFLKQRNIDPTSFDPDKFRTPHLIHSRVFDQDGSQTTIRIQPTLGFYLDSTMRSRPVTQRTNDSSDSGGRSSSSSSSSNYRYFLHLVGGNDGITDLTGNALDFQSHGTAGPGPVDHIAIDFALDTRLRPGTSALRFADNLAVYLVRRFAAADEDERPNLYLDTEITPRGGARPADAWPSPDLFGPVSQRSGELIARSPTRTTKTIDNLNQAAAPRQSSPLRYCPTEHRVTATATTVFRQPIQNPLNPFGCRMQMIWRELDMSLSRTDPMDFNLDVEQLYWAPFTQSPVVFDEFDRVSLFLGHAEYRPETCINAVSALPAMPNSGLRFEFAANYAHNLRADGSRAAPPSRHPAYVDATMTINATDAILEPNGIHRYLPLPKFVDARRDHGRRNPYFVWRDEREIVQGGDNGLTADTMRPYPYLLSPFLGGKGRRVTGPPDNPVFTFGGWHNGSDRQLRSGNYTDTRTGGSVGTIALPLLADFWSHPDSPDLPAVHPFRARGINGWQVSLPVTSSARPNFRAYSAGRGGREPKLVGPTHRGWLTAIGGYRPRGLPTTPADNTLYWVMADFRKRTTVATAGFVEIANPHRMPNGGDPRLGPYDVRGRRPEFVYDLQPAARSQPAGTRVTVEFRGASQLTRPNRYWPVVGDNRTTPLTFPLDPLKAGDAHIRHWDDRDRRGSTTPRNWWSYLYNDTVTAYTGDPNDLSDSAFTQRFGGTTERFAPRDVKYFNWRFLMTNNVAVDPPVTARIESFAVSYRLSND